MVGKWLGNASCNNLESKTQRLPIKYRAYQSCHHFALITRSIDPILYALAWLKMNRYFCRLLNRCTGLWVMGSAGSPVM